MPKNLEERRLLHQKGQQPTYGNGTPDNGEGLDGDLSYRKIDNQHKQFLKQDGIWNEVGSSSTTSSNDFQKGFILSDLAFRDLLYKYKNTITSWGYNWVVHGQNTTTFAAASGNAVFGTYSNPSARVYFQFTTGSSIQAGGVGHGNVFVVPKDCILEKISWLWSVPPGSDTDDGEGGEFEFEIRIFEDPITSPINSLFLGEYNQSKSYEGQTGADENGGFNRVGMNSNGGEELFHRIDQFYNCPFNVGSAYLMDITQVKGQFIAKGSTWAAYFKSTW